MQVSKLKQEIKSTKPESMFCEFCDMKMKRTYVYEATNINCKPIC